MWNTFDYLNASKTSLCNSHNFSHPSFRLRFGASNELFDIVDFAVDLRNDITKEFAIYSCFWYSADCKIDLDSGFCEFEGWRDDRPFVLCMFPGFSQSIKLPDGSIKEFCVKPARIDFEW